MDPPPPLSLPRETRAAGFGTSLQFVLQEPHSHGWRSCPLRQGKDTPARAHCRRNPSPVRAMHVMPPPPSLSLFFLSLSKRRKHGRATTRGDPAPRLAVVCEIAMV